MGAGGLRASRRFAPCMALHFESAREPSSSTPKMLHLWGPRMARSAPNKKSSIFYGAFLSFFYWGRADSGLPAGSRPAWRFTSSPHASQAAPPQRCCIFGDPGWLAPPPIKKAPFFMELFCPFFIGGGRTPGFPPVRALHGASLRVRTRAKQLHPKDAASLGTPDGSLRPQ